MTPDEAADLATRTYAAIDEWEQNPDPSSVYADLPAEWYADHRERVASDLAGLREVADAWLGDDIGTILADGLTARFAENLRRTADLYGVT